MRYSFRMALAEKVALVTGAARRIGRAIALRAKTFGMSIHYTNRSRLDASLEDGAMFHADPEALLEVRHKGYGGLRHLQRLAIGGQTGEALRPWQQLPAIVGIRL